MNTAVIRLGDNIINTVSSPADHIVSISEKPFVLFVSTFERRKNHEVLYKAYHILCSQGYGNELPNLIFVGMSGWGVTDLKKDIELDPVCKDKIFHISDATDSDLNYLYEKSLFCLYPSFYEGWGLPISEALVKGKFILASNTSSIPEVGGCNIEYLDPFNPRGWAEKIMYYTKNIDLLKMKEAEIKKNYQQSTWLGLSKQVSDLLSRMV